MNDALKLVASVRSSVLSKVPLLTPMGKPAKNGVVVATPAVPVNATAVGAWMWHAVVLPSSPENDACTRIVCRRSSIVISALPWPVEALGGASLAPLSVAE